MKPLIFIISALLSFASCKKYLDAKSDSLLARPETYDDLQAILDDESRINISVDLVNTMSDEYYIRDADWFIQEQPSKPGYIWDAETDAFQEWENQYRLVLYANVVLDHLPVVEEAGIDPQRSARIKGSALFLRSWSFFQLAQLFAKQYSAAATTDKGVPLRLNADFNQPTTRPSLQQTYDQITADLELAASLLPLDAGFKTRPDKGSAHALLARVYLQTGMYEKALAHASESLKIRNELIDFNDVPNTPIPFNRFNKEVLFHSASTTGLLYSSYYPIVDSVLYAFYSENDLRKQLYFGDLTGDGSIRFKGNYSGGDPNSIPTLFNGLATDEVYLVRAEAWARTGKKVEALKDLNFLLRRRYEKTSFVDRTATDEAAALKLILEERRKELVYRGTRWSDLRRLNPDPDFAVTISRKIEGKLYSLPPNDPGYVLPIPREIVQMTGIEQNKR